MASIENEPIKVEIPGPYRRARLPRLRETYLPQPRPISGSFATALTLRRSAEVFNPISIEDLASWLHYTASVRAINSEDRNRQRRFVGSFGALHPAHIVLGNPDGSWCAYLPENHVLVELPADLSAGQMLRTKATELFPAEKATLIALVSDADLAANYYQHPLSLILRDAGVLLGHAALVASSLGLGFRILGSTGTPFVEYLVPNLPFKPVAAGLAWIGGARVS